MSFCKSVGLAKPVYDLAWHYFYFERATEPRISLAKPVAGEKNSKKETCLDDYAKASHSLSFNSYQLYTTFSLAAVSLSHTSHNFSFLWGKCNVSITKDIPDPPVTLVLNPLQLSTPLLPCYLVSETIHELVYTFLFGGEAMRSPFQLLASFTYTDSTSYHTNLSLHQHLLSFFSSLQTIFVWLFCPWNELKICIFCSFVYSNSVLWVDALSKFYP